MSGNEQGYLAYLMRLWRDDDELQARGRCDAVKARMEWRASLERAGTGHRQSFSSLDALFAFLRRETGVIDDEEERPR